MESDIKQELDYSYYNDVKNKLDDDQIMSIVDYTDTSYLDINNFLLNGHIIFDFHENSRNKTLSEIACLRESIKISLLPIPVTVYHATPNSLFVNQSEKQSFIIKTFLSTTISKDIARTFVEFGEPCSIIEINLPAGYPALWLKHLSLHPYEEELLLSDGNEFDILDIKPEKNSFIEKYSLVKAIPKRM